MPRVALHRRQYDASLRYKLARTTLLASTNRHCVVPQILVPGEKLLYSDLRICSRVFVSGSEYEVVQTSSGALRSHKLRGLGRSVLS
eukprot:1914720-Rhodomonas_salina.2